MLGQPVRYGGRYLGLPARSPAPPGAVDANSGLNAWVPELTLTPGSLGGACVDIPFSVSCQP